MFIRTFNPRPFLQSVYGTEPFVEYCRSRNLPFAQVLGFLMRDDEYRRWQEVLRELPESEQARVELELAQVNEMAHPDAVSHLLKAAEGRELPSDLLPGDAAVALWFFL